VGLQHFNISSALILRNMRIILCKTLIDLISAKKKGVTIIGNAKSYLNGGNNLKPLVKSKSNPTPK